MCYKFMFQLHVYDSLYLQALAFSQVPNGIALIELQVKMFLALKAITIDPSNKNIPLNYCYRSHHMFWYEIIHIAIFQTNTYIHTILNAAWGLSKNHDT